MQPFSSHAHGQRYNSTAAVIHPTIYRNINAPKKLFPSSSYSLRSPLYLGSQIKGSHVCRCTYTTISLCCSVASSYIPPQSSYFLEEPALEEEPWPVCGCEKSVHELTKVSNGKATDLVCGRWRFWCVGSVWSTGFDIADDYCIVLQQREQASALRKRSRVLENGKCHTWFV